MAAALRFVAKRLCDGALSRRPPQAFLRAAKELPMPRRASLRRPFSSSTESSPAPNLLNNNKAESMTSLSARGLEKMQELHDILRQMSRQQALEFVREVENKKLLQDMDRVVRELRAASGCTSTPEFIKNNIGKLVAGTLAATGAVVYLETKFIFPLFRKVAQRPSSEKAE